MCRFYIPPFWSGSIERIPASTTFKNGKPKKSFLRRRCECGNVVESHVDKNGSRYYHATCKGCRKSSPGRIRRESGVCDGCGHRPVTPELLEVDHILPRARGGDNSRRNLQTLCANCHKIKTLLDRLPDHPDREAMLAGKHIQLASAVQQKLLEIA